MREDLRVSQEDLQVAEAKVAALTQELAAAESERVAQHQAARHQEELASSWKVMELEGQLQAEVKKSQATIKKSQALSRRVAELEEQLQASQVTAAQIQPESAWQRNEGAGQSVKSTSLSDDAHMFVESELRQELDGVHEEARRQGQAQVALQSRVQGLESELVQREGFHQQLAAAAAEGEHRQAISDRAAPGQTDREQIEQEKLALQAELNRCVEELEAARLEVKKSQAEVKNLISRLEQSEHRVGSDVPELEAQWQASKAVIVRLEAELEAASSAAKEEEAVLSRRVGELESQLGASETSVARLEAELATARAEEGTRREELAAVAHKAGEAQAASSILQDELTAELSLAEATIGHLQVQYLELSREFEPGELRVINRELQEEIFQLNAQLQAASELHAELTASTERESAVQASLMEALAANGELDAALQQLKEETPLLEGSAEQAERFLLEAQELSKVAASSMEQSRLRIYELEGMLLQANQDQAVLSMELSILQDQLGQSNSVLGPDDRIRLKELESLKGLQVEESNKASQGVIGGLEVEPGAAWAEEQAEGLLTEDYKTELLLDAPRLSQPGVGLQTGGDRSLADGQSDDNGGEERTASRLSSNGTMPEAAVDRDDYRQAQLRKVYQEFDLDANGDVGEKELLLLGQARRKLGQKQGEWTREMNHNMMIKIGTDNQGNLPDNNFVEYFDETISADRAEFDRVVGQFMECARACRQRKIEKREAEQAGQEEPLTEQERTAALFELHRALEMDGPVDEEALMRLGQARRRLGQRYSQWTSRLHAQLMRMGAGTGRVDVASFAAGLESLLPRDRDGFEAALEAFHRCRRRHDSERVADEPGDFPEPARGGASSDDSTANNSSSAPTAADARQVVASIFDQLDADQDGDCLPS